MGSRHHIQSLLSANPHFNSENRKIHISKNGGHLGTILEQHTTMFFVDVIGEMIANSCNISMNELKRDWKDVQKEFDEMGTSLEVFRMWVMKS